MARVVRPTSFTSGRSSDGAVAWTCDISVTVDHADPSWHGNVGVVTKLIARSGFDPHDTIAMICGPEVMMRFTAMALHEVGRFV